MKQFSHKTQLNSQQSTLARIEKRTNKQSTIFTLLFFIVLLITSAYIVYNLVVSQYDGYIVCRNIEVHQADDISVVEYFVKPGDVVNEGDTLFSYIQINWLNDYVNPNTIVSSDLRAIDAQLRYNRLKSQLQMERNSADSLYHLIETTKHDVELGVATLQMLEGREWEYSKMREQISHTERLISIEHDVIGSSLDYMSYSKDIEPADNYTYNERFEKKAAFGKAFKYKKAFVDMRIVELNANVSEIVYRQEPVLTYFPHNHSEISDLHIKLLLPPSKVSTISEGTVMEAYSGRQYLGEATAVFSSSFVKEDMKHKNKRFSSENENVIIRMELKSIDKFPNKFEIDKLPITLRYRKWKDLDKGSLLYKFMAKINRYENNQDE